MFCQQLDRIIGSYDTTTCTCMYMYVNSYLPHYLSIFIHNINCLSFYIFNLTFPTLRYFICNQNFLFTKQTCAFESLSATETTAKSLDLLYKLPLCIIAEHCPFLIFTPFSVKSGLQVYKSYLMLNKTYCSFFTSNLINLVMLKINVCKLV